MLNGQFTRGDGLVTPNTITELGRRTMLAAAFQGDSLDLYAALVFGSAAPVVVEADLEEPTIGVNGYARIPLAQGNVDWPTLDMEGSLARIASKVMTWAATGVGFDKEVNRIALMRGAARDNARQVWSVGSVWLAPLTIVPATPEIQRQFSYAVRV